jgi:hypothetical protein
MPTTADATARWVGMRLLEGLSVASFGLGAA